MWNRASPNRRRGSVSEIKSDYPVPFKENIMKKPQIVFMPGAFDGFDGTQEELDELLNELKAKIEDGTFFTESEEIDPEDLSPELRAKIERGLAEFEAGIDSKKGLH